MSGKVSVIGQAFALWRLPSPLLLNQFLKQTCSISQHFQQDGLPTGSHHLMALGIFAYCCHSNETAQPLSSPSASLSWGVIWLYMECWCALGTMSGTGEIRLNRPWSWFSHNWHSRLNLKNVFKINGLSETTLLLMCLYGTSIDSWRLFVFS